MTNFDLAPPPKTVDGLLAVPIDISTITARLRFDGATSTGTGDATIDFVVGPSAGSPIFDLRQTVTNAWLDGAPVPLAQVAHHDFGGGVDAPRSPTPSAATPTPSCGSSNRCWPRGRPTACASPTTSGRRRPRRPGRTSRG